MHLFSLLASNKREIVRVRDCRRPVTRVRRKHTHTQERGRSSNLHTKKRYDFNMHQCNRFFKFKQLVGIDSDKLTIVCLVWGEI
jgi:hypothetical protein